MLVQIETSAGKELCELTLDEMVGRLSAGLYECVRPKLRWTWRGRRVVEEVIGYVQVYVMNESEKTVMTSSSPTSHYLLSDFKCVSVQWKNGEIWLRAEQYGRWSFKEVVASRVKEFDERLWSYMRNIKHIGDIRND